MGKFSKGGYFALCLLCSSSMGMNEMSVSLREALSAKVNEHRISANSDFMENFYAFSKNHKDVIDCLKSLIKFPGWSNEDPLVFAVHKCIMHIMGLSSDGDLVSPSHICFCDQNILDVSKSVFLICSRIDNSVANKLGAIANLINKEALNNNPLLLSAYFCFARIFDFALKATEYSFEFDKEDKNVGMIEAKFPQNEVLPHLWNIGDFCFSSIHFSDKNFICRNYFKLAVDFSGNAYSLFPTFYPSEKSHDTDCILTPYDLFRPSIGFTWPSAIGCMYAIAEIPKESFHSVFHMLFFLMNKGLIKKDSNPLLESCYSLLEYLCPPDNEVSTLTIYALAQFVDQGTETVNAIYFSAISKELFSFLSSALQEEAKGLMPWEEIFVRAAILFELQHLQFNKLSLNIDPFLLQRGMLTYSVAEGDKSTLVNLSQSPILPNLRKVCLTSIEGDGDDELYKLLHSQGVVGLIACFVDILKNPIFQHVISTHVLIIQFRKFLEMDSHLINALLEVKDKDIEDIISYLSNNHSLTVENFKQKDGISEAMSYVLSFLYNGDKQNFLKKLENVLDYREKLEEYCRNQEDTNKLFYGVLNDFVLLKSAQSNVEAKLQKQKSSRKREKK